MKGFIKKTTAIYTALGLLLFTSFVFPHYAEAAVAYDANELIPYTGSGGNSVSHTGTGSNLVAVLLVWSDGTVSSVTYGGTTMTLATSHAVTHAFTATMSIYVMPNAPSGSKTVSYSSTGQSTGNIITFSGASGTQPDATAYVSSTQAGMGDATLPVTTVTNNSIIVGMFGSSNNINAASINSNGTFIGAEQFGTSFDWYTTSPVTPAGSNSLIASSNSAGQNGTAFEAVGISIAPFTAPAGGTIFHKITLGNGSNTTINQGTTIFQ